MSSSKLIDQIIEAIDQGIDIDIDWERAASTEEYKQIKALLSVHRISKRINQKQQDALEHNFSPGDQWMHLIIHETIGAGGFGQVYRAFDSVLQTDVAVKFLNQNMTGIADKDFLNEARLMATVRNPHVLAIHGAAKDKGISGYWSDYLDGDILYNYLQSNTINDREKTNIIKNLTLAVKATHDNGVIHGDIKSLNVMLQPNRGAILLDFGSGRTGLANNESIEFNQASPIAMAPEQFAGQGNSQPADIFALGLLIVEVLTGQHPLANKTYEQIKSAVNDLPTVIREMPIPKKWVKLLSAMLSENIQLRPNIATISSQLTAIEEKPLKRAKATAWVLSLLLMATITSLSLYSQWSIREANQETESINQILRSTFLTVSPYKQGEQVRLLDALQAAEEKIKSSDLLSENLKQGLLTEILFTSMLMSENDEQENVVHLAKYILNMKPLSKLSEMTARRVLGIFYGDQRRFDLATTELLKVTKFHAESVQEYDQLIGAMVELAKNDLDQQRFESFLQRKEQVNQIKLKSSMSANINAQIVLLEAEYYGATKQWQLAQVAFDQAAIQFAAYYHENHLLVLASLGGAASHQVLIDDAETQQVGIERLIALIPRMTHVMGDDHINTIILKLNLAQALITSGQADKAIKVLLPMQEVIDQKLGVENLLTVTEYKKFLGWAYQDTGQITLAENTLKEIVNSLKQNYAADSFKLIRAYIDLIQFYQETDQVNKATTASEQALVDAQKAYGDNHRLTLEVEALLIWQDHLRGKESSLTDMQFLYQKHVKLFGDDDYRTQLINYDIEQIRAKK